MLAEMTDFIDVIVPRGGKGLEKVQDTAKIGDWASDGICHVYVDKSSKPSEASKIVENAKLKELEYVVLQKLYLLIEIP